MAYSGQSNIAVNNGGNLTLSNVILTGTGGIIKTGNGTLSIIGTAASNTNTGGLTVSEGVVSVDTVGNVGSLSGGGGVAVNGGTLRFTGGTAPSGSARVFSVGNATGTFDINPSVTTQISGNVTNVIGQVGALNKIGAGTLSLNGTANTYTGLTTVSDGLLVISFPGGSSGLVSGNALTLGASGTADFQNAGQTLGAVSNANTATNALNFSNAAGTTTLASLSGAGNTRFGSNATITGGVSSGTVTTVGLLTSDVSGGTVSANNLTGAISGTAAVTVSGLTTGTISGGTLGTGSLSSSSVTGGTNTVTGAADITTLSGGTTTVGGVATIGTMSSGVANLNGTTSTIGTLSGGTLALGSNAILTVSGGSSAGSVTLGSGSNFKYNSGSAFTGSLINNGGTISGNGTLSVDLALNSLNDKLSPGNSPGIQTLNADQTWSSFSYDWEINNWSASVAGTNFDQIAITGNLNLTGASAGAYALNVLSLLGDNTSGAVSNFAESTISRTILTASSTTAFNAGFWTIDVSGFTNAEAGTFGLANVGNELILTYTPIPEPSAFAALAGLGVIGFVAYRRRRQTNAAKRAA